MNMASVANTGGGGLPRVLQLRSSAGLYGADRAVLGLDAALASSGRVHSRLATVHNPLLPSQLLLEESRRRGRAALDLPCAGRFDRHTLAALSANVDAQRVDVVHAHDYKSAFLAWIACRRRPVRLVATQHGWVESTLALRAYHSLEAVVLRRFDAVVMVSAAQRPRLVRAGVPESRLHQIGNGIELPPGTGNRPAVAGVEPGDGHVFAAVGRLSPEKNIGLLLAAFARVVQRSPRARLLLAGDGPQRSALEASAAQLGIADRVSFLGVRDDVAALWPGIDTLALPSLSEGMPLVVLEAMAHGVPVVASAVGEVPSLLSQAEHGRLVVPGDVHALASALLAALADGRRRDARASAYVRAHHGLDTVADAHAALYLGLLEQPRARASA